MSISSDFLYLLTHKKSIIPEDNDTVAHGSRFRRAWTYSRRRRHSGSRPVCSDPRRDSDIRRRCSSDDTDARCTPATHSYTRWTTDTKHRLVARRWRKY